MEERMLMSLLFSKLQSSLHSKAMELPEKTENSFKVAWELYLKEDRKGALSELFAVIEGLVVQMCKKNEVELEAGADAKVMIDALRNHGLIEEEERNVLHTIRRYRHVMLYPREEKPDTEMTDVALLLAIFAIRKLYGILEGRKTVGPELSLKEEDF